MGDPLVVSATVGEELVDGKAQTLGDLLRDGWPVPPGVAVSTLAYDCFRREGDLERRVRMELDCKLLEGMRWEELWDAVNLEGSVTNTNHCHSFCHLPHFLPPLIPSQVPLLVIRSDIVGIHQNESTKNPVDGCRLLPGDPRVPP